MPDVVDELLANPPAVHGDEDAGQTRETHGLSTPALRFIAATVEPGDLTLETGAGYSTIVFTRVGAKHTAIIPNAFEGDRIREYCDANGIATRDLEFIFEPSERVLPGLEATPLDFVLIDGSHSFPHTFIDWFYTAHRLKVGGWMLIDDIHLWTGRELRDFLRKDPAWAMENEFLGRTALFRKVAATDPDVLWTDQPVVVKRSGLKTRARVHQVTSMLRHGQRDELRTLLKQTLGR
jgi:hypothetical protein